MAKTITDQVAKIVNQENARAAEWICLRTRPLIQKEFDRLQKKYVTLEKILFGNGTFFIVFSADDARRNDYNYRLPKDFDNLRQMCELVCTVMEDVVS